MNIKKHISLILSFLILVANMGLALNVHYCKGEVTLVSFAYKIQDPCSYHPKEKTKTCCGSLHDDTHHKPCCKNDLVKLKDKADDTIIVKSNQLDLTSFYVIDEWSPIQFYNKTPIVKNQTPAFYCDANAPPLFKLYCSYILYA